ncbi:hypothetical protein Tco_0408387 [Tanacetum coccineum]
MAWQKANNLATSSMKLEYVAAAHCRVDAVLEGRTMPKGRHVRLDLEVILCFDGEKVHNLSLVLVINHSYWLIPIGPGGSTVTTG